MKKDLERRIYRGLKSSACKTFAISSTSKSVIKYNLTSFRNRVGVQAIFGRPLVRLRLELASAPSESPAYLRVLIGTGGVAGLLDRIEFAELKIEEFAVDGLVLDGLKGHEIVGDEAAMGRHAVDVLIVIDG